MGVLIRSLRRNRTLRRRPLRASTALSLASSTGSAVQNCARQRRYIAPKNAPHPAMPANQTQNRAALPPGPAAAADRAPTGSAGKAAPGSGTFAGALFAAAGSPFTKLYTLNAEASLKGSSSRSRAMPHRAENAPFGSRCSAAARRAMVIKISTPP